MSALLDALRVGPVAIEGDVRVTVDVVDCDRLGVSIGTLRVTGERGPLLERVERLVALESLPVQVRAIEVDPGLGGAVLRSAPRRREYFEVRTDGQEVSVEKVRLGLSGRERVPYTLTREQLGRMVDDLADVLR